MSSTFAEQAGNVPDSLRRPLRAQRLGQPVGIAVRQSITSIHLFLVLQPIATLALDLKEGSIPISDGLAIRPIGTLNRESISFISSHTCV